MRSLKLGRVLPNVCEYQKKLQQNKWKMLYFNFGMLTL